MTPMNDKEPAKITPPSEPAKATKDYKQKLREKIAKRKASPKKKR